MKTFQIKSIFAIAILMAFGAISFAQTYNSFSPAVGKNITEGDNNTFGGYFAGDSVNVGSNNSFFGYGTGFKTTTGKDNSFIGFKAGFNNVNGSGNVFIGCQAGANEMGSGKLYIANSDTDNPLIYGDFKRGVLGVGTSEIPENFTMGIEGGLYVKSGKLKTDLSARIGKNLNVDGNIGSLNALTGNDAFPMKTMNFRPRRPQKVTRGRRVKSAFRPSSGNWPTLWPLVSVSHRVWTTLKVWRPKWWSTVNCLPAHQPDRPGRPHRQAGTLRLVLPSNCSAVKS